MTPFRFAAIFAAALLTTPTGARAQAEPTTVFVVRHAEKGPETPDPDLTAVGTSRAKALAQLLADANVSTIFASEFKRTQQTAAPLATRLGISTTVIGAAKMDDLIAQLKALAPGSRALVVSHSNLVPVIVERLSGKKVGEMTDSDYDRIYSVTLASDGTGSVVYLHFGGSSTGTGGPMRP